jgi:hypothetical protein
MDLDKMLSLFNIKNNVLVPTYDELKNYLLELQRASAIELIVNGQSKNGNDIFFVKVGSGPRNIAITGGAHSDEPAGIATCMTLIKELAENPKLNFLKDEFTFLIHPCLDPDGAQLNYSWANTSSYTEYLLKNFRNNDPSNDVEHGIPVKDSQTIRPELKILMSNLFPYKDKLDFYVTLHTTHTTGGSMVLLYGDKKLESMIEVFSKKASELKCPMADYRPKEEEGLTYIAPGFMKSPSYNDFKKLLKDNLSLLDGYKMTTYEWANLELHTPLCMIAEFPFFLDVKINDNTPSEIDYADFLKSSLKLKTSLYHKVCNELKKAQAFALDEENPWYKKAIIFRDNALASYTKDEKYFEQFSGLKASVGELHYWSIEKIELEMKPFILSFHLLENIPEAKKELETALSNFKKLEEVWMSVCTGHILNIETQVQLQMAMIISGLIEL